MPCVPALSVHEAWEIANAWNHELTRQYNTSISLRTDASSSIRVTESFEWVEIASSMRNSGRLESYGQHGGLLRAVCSTWTMLASCPGYGGDENPVFWKYLFAEWRQDYDSDISDADRFFTRHSFPRFRLTRLHCNATRGQGAVMCRAFFGVDQVTTNSAYEHVQSKFQELRARLIPVVDMERLRRPVEVSLELSSEYMDSSVSAVSSQDNSGDSDVVRFIQREVNVKGVIHSCPPSIAYLLCPTDPPSVQSSHGLLMELLKTQSVEIPRVEFKVEYEDEKAYYELINLSCNVDGCSSARVRSIEICRDYVSNQEAATLFSALPHARSLRVLRYKRPNFDVDRSNLSALMAPEWAWIGYALFHPATVTSTWRELQLEIIQISADAQRILTAMSQGNNLLAILNGTPAGNRAYFTTTLASGSSFVRNPMISALPIMQFDDMKTVDAVVTSTDLSPLDEFVPLVVPGLGLVYTRRDNVLQLTGRPASPVCLTALHFQSFDFYGSTTEQAPGMLKLLGSKLEHLGIFGIENFAVEDLRQLLVLTLALQSLVTDAKCVLWSGYEVDEAIAAMPKLQELEIAMSSSDTINTPSELALCTYLRDLRALRVKVWEQADLDQHDEMVLPRSLGGILTILRGLPEFEYLHWYHFLHIGSRDREIRRYAASRQCTWKKIGVGFSPSDREARFILPCGHAFLTAVHATPSTSTLGQFGQDILDLILQFASVYRPRDITIKRRPLYTPPPNVPLVSAFAASTN